MEKDYLLIANFNYNNKKYAYLLDDNNRNFFLQIDSIGQYSYVSLKELLLLNKIFSKPIHILKIKKSRKKKFKLVPKVLLGTMALSLTINLVNLILKPTSKNVDISDTLSYTQSIQEENIDEIEKLLEDPYFSQDLEIDTYSESKFLNKIYVYDMSYLDNVLDHSFVSFDDVRELIKNRDFSSKYKDLLFKFINDLELEHPNIDLRVFYENLKTLDIIECSKRDLTFKSLSSDSYACYRKDENIIYVLEDFDFSKDSWAFQVIYHELSHVLRSAIWNHADKEIRVQFADSSNHGTIIEEALNSLFSVGLYNKNENDIAYQLQSNYLRIILGIMDNYSLEDYVHHNFSYFLEFLNDLTQNEDAKWIMALIELQYNDYHNDDISVEQQEYYPIYEYIVDIFMSRYSSPDMSMEELLALIDNLINQIVFDVPEEYNIDVSYIREYALSYYQAIEVSSNLNL